MMQIDTVKLVITYAMAAVVIVGGGIMLYASRLEDASDFQLVLAGFVASAITFLFGQESATRATRAAERAANKTTVTVQGTETR